MDLSDAVIVKSSRLKSLVWNDFDRVKKGETCVAICRHCQKKLSGSSNSGTSHLRNHLLRCQRRPINGIAPYYPTRGNKKEASLAVVNIDQEQRNEVLNIVNVKYDLDQYKEDCNGIGVSSLDQRRGRFDLARMIILHGYPLKMVDHIGFKIFVRNLQPLFEPVTFDRVVSDCGEIYAKEKHKVFDLLDKLPGKLSISADVWAASEDAEFLCLTGHYIDSDWNLKKKVLNFIMVDQSHADNALVEVVMECLREWDIDRKVFAMTFDNCPTNDKVVGSIQDRLSQNRFLYCNGQLFDVWCATNVIDLMAQDVLEALFEITYKIRESIQYVRSSQVTQSKFDEMVLQAGVESQKLLCLDNPLRWDLTFFMLEAALEYKDAFCFMQEHDADYTVCPSEVEWERAIAIVGFLKLFVEVTNSFIRAKYPTANIYFPEICDIHLQLIEWSANPDDYISSLATKMRIKFDEYRKKCGLALAVAVMLDPRYKMKLIEYYYPQLYGSDITELVGEILDCVKALYNEHSIGSPLASIDQGMSWQMNDNANSSRNPSDKLMGFDKYVHESAPNQSSKADLDNYLEDSLFPRTGDFDVLNWWRVHTPRYPILSMMAKNILSMPMSKVTPESAFNTGRRVLNGDWSSLDPVVVSGLMCSQDWLRSELES